MSKFSTAIVPIVSIGVGVVLLSVAYAATNTDSAAQSPGPNPPALEKNERQMERATKVRAAKQLKAAKAKWAHLARVKAEKARKAELARQEDRPPIDREAARQAANRSRTGFRRAGFLAHTASTSIVRQKTCQIRPVAQRERTTFRTRQVC